MEQLKFLTPEQVRNIGGNFQLPVYVYSEKKLKESAKLATSFPNAFGLTARFAMKSSPNAAILKIFANSGMHIDASSGYEVERAMLAGISPDKILLSAQELAHNLESIVKKGVNFNACSLRQIEAFGKLFPGKKVGLRFNPGLGSGGTKRTNVGGPSSSFGIWHEQLEEAKNLVSKYNLEVERIHTHIGSGSDPEIWNKVAGMSMALLEHFEKATILNLGGGYKVGRMSSEVSTDLLEVGKPVVEVFKEFKAKTGREIRLEIEPGTFMVALSACVIAKIDDVISTSTQNGEGYLFYKTTTGMTDILRPSLYGAQHPIVIVPQVDTKSETVNAVVVGHCCESGDILTPQPGDPEALSTRELIKAEVGDLVVVEGAGAYCSSMSSKNYNSFPESAELLLTESGEIVEIRKRQKLHQIFQNEVLPEYLK